MTSTLYRATFVEVHALFPEILRFEFATLFMKHPVDGQLPSVLSPIYGSERSVEIVPPFTALQR